MNIKEEELNITSPNEFKKEAYKEYCFYFNCRGSFRKLSSKTT